MSNQRQCYCRLWQSQPDVLQEQGLPAGFCGWCMTCKKPGHTRHHPGPVPMTGAWCDYCYGRLAWFQRAKKWGSIALALLCGVAWFLYSYSTA